MSSVLRVRCGFGVASYPPAYITGSAQNRRYDMALLDIVEANLGNSKAVGDLCYESGEYLRVESAADICCLKITPLKRLLGLGEPQI